VEVVASAQMADDPIELIAGLPAPAAAGTAGEAFDAFFRREHPRLVALAAAIAGPAQAEDLAQEALARAHARWSRVSRYDKPGAWARRVTLNLALSARRSAGREGRALHRLAARPQVQVTAPEPDGFWALVHRLPDRQAAAVALRYLEDLSIAEIAAAMGCAEGTAKAHLHQARATLAAHLGAHADEEDR
jgi:RNA polymerase sigma-70 factor, ECF subfamily